MCKELSDIDQVINQNMREVCKLYDMAEKYFQDNDVYLLNTVDSTARRNILANAMQLVKVSKGKVSYWHIRTQSTCMHVNWLLSL